MQGIDSSYDGRQNIGDLLSVMFGDQHDQFGRSTKSYRPDAFRNLLRNILPEHYPPLRRDVRLTDEQRIDKALLTLPSRLTKLAAAGVISFAGLPDDSRELLDGILSQPQLELVDGPEPLPVTHEQLPLWIGPNFKPWDEVTDVAV